MRSSSTYTGSAKFRSSSDSGVENSKTWPFWYSRLKPRLRNSNSRSLQQALCRVGLTAFFASAWLAPFGFSGATALGGGCSGKNTCSRVPSRQRQHALGHFVHRVLLHLLAALAGNRCGPTRA